MTNINYYGQEADYIHLKFGDARKMYFFTEGFRNKYPLFAKEYAKYFSDKSTSQFENPFQIVNYVFEHEIPVHFYYNFTDTPAKDQKEIIEYLVGENSYIGELEDKK